MLPKTDSLHCIFVADSVGLASVIFDVSNPKIYRNRWNNAT